MVPKQTLTIVALLLLSVSVAFATGQGEGADGVDPPTQLRMAWWGGDARHEATLATIEAYMIANPSVTIDAEYGGFDGYYQKLLTQLAARTSPDIMQITPEWFETLHEQGEPYYPLDADLSLLDTTGFDQTYISENCSIDGTLYGLPTGMNGMTIVYNKDFFTEHGIPEDTVWNWDSFLRIGRRVHQENPEHYLVAQGTSFIPRAIVMQETGEPGWITDDFQIGFKQETLVEAFAYLQQLYQEGVVQPASETFLYSNPTENPRWVNGQVGMALEWASAISTLKAEGLNLGVARFPIAEGAKDSGIISGPPQFMVVSKYSSVPEEAVRFLNYFFNDPEAITTLQEVRGPQPTAEGRRIISEAGLADPLVTAALDIIAQNSSAAFNLKVLMREVSQPYEQVWEELVFDQTDAQSATADLLEEYDRRLADLRSQN